MAMQSKKTQVMFADAIQIHFPEWDAGAVYGNVLGAMLYPDLGSKWKSFVIRMQLEQKGLSKKERQEEYSSFQCAQDLASLHVYLSDSDNLQKILFSEQTNTPQNEFDEKKHRGQFVGKILRTACRNKVSVHKSFDILAKGEDAIEIKNGRKLKQISRSSFSNRIWKEFSPVAHYWAAYEFFSSADGSWECPPPYRYPDQHFFSKERFDAGKPNGFRGFLLVADSYLKWATSFVPPTHAQGKTLMEMRESVYFYHPYYEIV
ncbi:hypothetical protein [Desulfovibrio sp. QI0434]